MCKIGRTRGNLHPMMDGDRDGDPHWSTGLSPQGPHEEQKEGEHEKGSQDRERWCLLKPCGLPSMLPVSHSRDNA